MCCQVGAIRSERGRVAWRRRGTGCVWSLRARFHPRQEGGRTMTDEQLAAPATKRRRTRTILAVAAAVVVVVALASIATVALLRNTNLSSQAAAANARAANAVSA